MFMPVDKSAFSIHCYRSMLATDFAAYGLPSSLRKPRAASSFDTLRNDRCPPLGERGATCGRGRTPGLYLSHKSGIGGTRVRRPCVMATCALMLSFAAFLFIDPKHFPRT